MCETLTDTERASNKLYETLNTVKTLSHRLTRWCGCSLN